MFRFGSFRENQRQHLVPAILLVAAVFVVYGRIMGHDFLFIWDDNYYVTENPDSWGLTPEHVRAAFSRFYLGNYAPVQIVSYMLDHDLWGLRAGGYLFTNILLHALNGLMVYRLLFRWYASRTVSLVAAALFLLHPVQVESVAWISQRKNLLAMLFFLLAWECYCRYRDSKGGKGRLAYLASLAAFSLSLLAKSMTIVFPLILVLFDYAFPGGDRRLRFRDKIPFLVAAVAVAVVAVYSERPDVGGGGRTGYHGGSPWATFLTMLPVFCQYLRMIVWPAGLSAEYAPTIHTGPDAPVIMAALLLLGVAAAGVLLFRRDRRAGFWVAYFWIGLLPLSQIVPMLSMINDRYLYLPLLGVAALAGTAAERLLERVGQRPAVLVRAGLLGGGVVLALLSYQRCGVWSDSVTLFRDAVAKAPASDRVWALLADSYEKTGNFAAFRRTCEQALAYNPRNDRALNGLGDYLTMTGEPEKGLEYLNRLLQLHPRHAPGWLSLGNNRLARGDFPGAEKAYQEALAIQPDALQPRELLGDLYVKEHKFQLAREQYLKVEKSGDGDPGSAFNLARVEALLGDREASFGWLEQSLQLGFRDYDTLYDCRDLATLWGDPRFNYLLTRYFPGRTEGR